MYLDVGKGHNIYFEEYGNPNGVKILFLHGGPGLGFSDNDKSFFNPDKFYVIFMDQRGCGRSLPKGSLVNNTTQDLISDIEKILDHLNIQTLTIFGGSWGATLAILYAAKSPKRVTKLILRGFFSATKETANIYLRGGIESSHQENWERVISFVPTAEQDAIPEYYFESILHKPKESKELAYEWSRYGLSLSRKHFAEEELDQILGAEPIDLDRIGIELHYALNEFFIPNGFVFEQAAKIENIPSIIIHGEYDYLCPVIDALKLTSLLRKSELRILDAGHSTAENIVRESLFQELDRL